MFLNAISGNLGNYWFKIMKSDLLTYVILFTWIFFVHKFSIAFCFYSGVTLNELRKLIWLFGNCIWRLHSFKVVVNLTMKWTLLFSWNWFVITSKMNSVCSVHIRVFPSYLHVPNFVHQHSRPAQLLLTL